jgi:glyoxylase-like metal-dependent hydrolase (beta-lactamase superfamily II)
VIDVATHNGVACVQGTHAAYGMPWSVYLFFFDGMVVDASAKVFEKALIPFYQSNPIDMVVLTHTHDDHIGTAGWLENNKRVPIYVHPGAVDFCSEPCDYAGTFREALWGKRDPFAALPLGEAIDSLHYTWRVIETPGHAPDHVVLLNEELGILFSGDLFITPKPKVIMSHESVPQMMRSLRKVLAYDFQSVYCCHAGYLSEGKKMLQMKLDYLEEMVGKVSSLFQQGYSIAEIDQQLFPDKFPITSISDGRFDSVHMVRSIVEELAGMK